MSRYHVHGKFEHGGIAVDFSFSLNALTGESAEIFVRDLLEPDPRLCEPLRNPEITGIDCELEHDRQTRRRLRILRAKRRASS